MHDVTDATVAKKRSPWFVAAVSFLGTFAWYGTAVYLAETQGRLTASYMSIAGFPLLFVVMYVWSQRRLTVSFAAMVPALILFATPSLAQTMGLGEVLALVGSLACLTSLIAGLGVLWANKRGKSGPLGSWHFLG